MWVGFHKTGLTAFKGKARTAGGSFTKPGATDSGIGHKGAGAMGGIHTDPPMTPEQEAKLDATYSSARLAFDGLAGF